MPAFVIFIFTLVFTHTLSAQKSITLEDIYVKGTFRTASIPGFNFLKDGQHYTRKRGSTIQSVDILTGEVSATLFDGAQHRGKADFTGDYSGFTFNHDESLILLETNAEQVYRHSSKVICFLFNTKTEELVNIFPMGKIVNPAFSPDGKKIAFVHENNLYYYTIADKKAVQVTHDGKTNAIINGMCDWVYEEEFGFTQAYYWSPNSTRLAFLRFDESQVPEFTMQLYYNELYPVSQTFKYPKVGEKNAEVAVSIYDLNTQKTHQSSIGKDKDGYIPRVKWTQDADVVCIYELNRHQNHLKLHLLNAAKLTSEVLYEETSEYYIDIHDDLTFLKDGKHFIWSSEKEGYNQLYLMDMSGKTKRKITAGNYDVSVLYGVDESRKKVYFQAGMESPVHKHVYAVSLDGGMPINLTPSESGTNSAQFSSTFSYFTHTYSSANTAPVYTLYDIQGKKLRTLEDNASYAAKQSEYNTSPVTFFTFTTSENITLNGWMIKPVNFDPNVQYPVFMTQYSGPGSQQVTDSWKGSNYWWYQMLVQQGYIVVCVDGRGTGGRGEAFKKMTYLQLGHYETLDQIEAAKYLGSLPYVDKTRIGIFGWSYGGFMSSLCILKGSEFFKAAIAVAPVTSWKWYDTIYTERYMRTVQENERGYTENSPVNFAHLLKGNYLLIHGMADDNVHFQHAVEMANALIREGKQFDTYYYPNRNHGIYGDNATIHLYTKMTQFIKEKL
jgi:dipeptidyl-peptidase-4